MKNYNSITGVIFFVLIIFFLVRCSEEPTNNNEKSNLIEDSKNDPIILEAEPYIDKIVYEDIELRSLASSVTKGCSSGNKECQLNKVYHYVVDNFDYYSDPRSKEFIQSPNDTLKVKGGDCEDLTILMTSLLENLGFKTYLVLTDNHAYALACGVTTDDLWKYIEQSIIETASSELGTDSDYNVEIKSGKLFLVENVEQTFALNPGDVWYYGGDGSNFTDPIQYVNIVYSIHSSTPLNIYFVPSKKEHTKIVNAESFNHYPTCQKENIYQVSDSCDSIYQFGGIILVDTDPKNSAKVDINLNFSYAYSTQGLFSNEKMTYYEMGGEQCVVLEATAGKYGFPGFDSTVGRKIAVDPVTKEYYSLK
jgi:hypothetical protein